MSDARPPERQPNESPGDFLGRMLSRAGTNPNRLAEKLAGEISATTIRSYASGSKATLPRLRLIASGLGKYGTAVLRAYGENEAAEDLEAELDEARRPEPEPKSFVKVRYRGRDLTEDEVTAVRVFIETVIARN